VRILKIGDIVMAKKDSCIAGEVTAIDDWDRVTVKLPKSGLEVMVDISELEEYRIGTP